VCSSDLKNGIIPLAKVKVGDRVLTHKRRWRKVTAVHKNEVQKGHRFAILVSPTGRLVGVTDDHLVFTRKEWMSAKEAANGSERVVSMVREKSEEKRIRSLSSVLDEETMDWKTGKGETVRSYPSPQNSPDSVRGSDRVFVQHDEGRRPKVCPVLGRGYTSICVPVSMEVGEEARPDSERVRHSPQEPPSVGRRLEELGTEASSRSPSGSRERDEGKSASREVSCLRKEIQDEPRSAAGRHQREILLQRVLPKKSIQRKERALCRMRSFGVPQPVRSNAQKQEKKFLLSALLCREYVENNQDPCMHLLRIALQEESIRDQEVEGGQVLLLPGSLEEGAALYDITVEEDRSFVVEGLVIHNSNCRDSIVARPGHEGEAEHLRLRADYDLLRHIEALNRIKVSRKRYDVLQYFPRPETDPVKMPQQEPPEVHHPEPDVGKPKYDIATRQKKYTGDSVEEKPMKDRVLHEEELDEGILDVIRSFKGFSAARGMMNDLKNLGTKLDFATLYMVVGVIPHGAPEPVIKAGPVTDMVRWIASASDIHEKLGFGRLYWTLHGVSTFREQVERKNVIMTGFGTPKQTNVWIGDPRDEAGIASFLSEFALSKEHTGGMKLMGVKGIDPKAVNIARSREEEENRIAGIMAGSSKTKGLVKWALGLESCRRGSRASLMETIRTQDRRTNTEAKKNVNEGLAKILGLTAVGAVLSLKGTAKALYQASIGLNFISIFPIIAIYPLAVESETGNIAKINPVLVSGNTKDLIHWMNTANEVHKRFHDNRDMKYEILGLTSFRQDATAILHAPQSFVIGGTAHWVDDPKDVDAIEKFILGDLPIEQMHPDLASKVLLRRVRAAGRGEREVGNTPPTQHQQKGRHATGKGGVYGYDANLP
jgi:hypothetical protein